MILLPAIFAAGYVLIGRTRGHAGARDRLHRRRSRSR